MRKFFLTPIFLFILFVAFAAPTTANAYDVEIIPLPDISIPVVNPCNNQDVIITWTDLTLTTHSWADSTEGVRELSILEGTVYDTSGFSGQLRRVTRVNGPDPDNYRESDRFMLIARNRDTQQTIVLEDIYHLSVIDGVPTVDIDHFNEQCYE